MKYPWTESPLVFAPYVYTFIPIFVAIDIIGIIPIYTSLTTVVPRPDRHKIAVQSIIAAFVLSIAFLVGKTVFSLLGIMVVDFQVAGGALLFVVAIVDLIGGGKPQREPSSQIGVMMIRRGVTSIIIETAPSSGM